MTEPYNPFVRTFCRFRAGLLDCIDVDRRAIRPTTPQESLLPESSRRAVWENLRRRGLEPPTLELSERDSRRITWGVLRVTIELAISLRSWAALPLALPLSAFACWANLWQAVHLPRDVTTVGELVFATDRFGRHKDSGYRWTHNEIELKVRLIIAASMGLGLDEIRPECTLKELGAMACGDGLFGKPARPRHASH